MSDPHDDDATAATRAAAADAITACVDAARALEAAGIATEALAAFVPEGRRMLAFRRPATMQPLGEVWRLGVLLLDRNGQLYAAGRATRAAERGRVGYQSVSREERRDIAAAALRAGYAVGAPVNFDAVPLSLDEIAAGRAAATVVSTQEPHSGGTPSDKASLIGVALGAVRVRWRPGAPLESGPTLAAYLAERVALLVDPPQSST